MQHRNLLSLEKNHADGCAKDAVFIRLTATKPVARRHARRRLRTKCRIEHEVRRANTAMPGSLVPYRSPVHATEPEATEATNFTYVPWLMRKDLKRLTASASFSKRVRSSMISAEEKRTALQRYKHSCPVNVDREACAGSAFKSASALAKWSNSGNKDHKKTIHVLRMPVSMLNLGFHMHSLQTLNLIAASSRS